MGVRLHYFGAMKRQRDDSIKAKTEEVGDMKVDHGSGNADGKKVGGGGTQLQQSSCS